MVKTRLNPYKAWSSLPDEKRDTHFIVVDGKPVILGDHNCCRLREGDRGEWSEMFRSPNFNTETGEYHRDKPPEVFELHPYAKQDREVMALAYPNG